MKKIALYSFLLILGLVGSQYLSLSNLNGDLTTFIRTTTMICLAFIMIQVGFEFNIDKKHARKYGWDYIVAATAATFPWVFCAIYFVIALPWDEDISSLRMWKEALMTSRFASPTSAGVLFSMLAAAGLSGSWVFRKARILAIFDDLDTVLFIIPLQISFIGFQWGSLSAIFFITIQLWIAWRYLHSVPIPSTWPWVLFYSIVITALVKIHYYTHFLIGHTTPIQMEVLLPAFILGIITAHSGRKKQSLGNKTTNHIHIRRTQAKSEKIALDFIPALFMLLVGLSTPPFIGCFLHDSSFFDTGPANAHECAIAQMSWMTIFWHVFIIFLLSNLGKMFPAFCYRKTASWQERLALAICMFPRGEVGAGVLLVSISLDIQGPIIIIAILSLIVNLSLTGVFIVFVTFLLNRSKKPDSIRLQN